MFNALKYTRILEGVGFKREQAEAQVQLIIDSYEENVATKADVSILRSEMSELRNELKTDIAELRAEIKSDFSNLFVKLISAIAVATGILGILIKF